MKTIGIRLEYFDDVKAFTGISEKDLEKILSKKLDTRIKFILQPILFEKQTDYSIKFDAHVAAKTHIISVFYELKNNKTGIVTREELKVDKSKT